MKTDPERMTARRVRDFTLSLCEPLALEDYVLQNMADVSPTKWHLAHTTWFPHRRRDALAAEARPALASDRR
jgi:hypothetical protein